MNSWRMVLILFVIAILAWGLQEMTSSDESSVEDEISFMRESGDRLKRLGEFPEPGTQQSLDQEALAVESEVVDGVDRLLDDLSSGDLEQATEYYLENMVELSPVLDVAKAVINAWAKKGDYEQAINLLYEQRLFVAFDKEDAWLLYIGTTVSALEEKLLDQSDFTALIAMYQLLVSLHPDHTPYYLKLAHWQIEVGRKDDAQRSLSGTVNDIEYEDEVTKLQQRLEAMDEELGALVIPLSRIGDQFSVKAFIDESTVVELLLDTGASRTVIKSELAEQGGLSLSEGEDGLVLSTANGKVQAQKMLVSSFALESVPLDVKELLVLPLPELSFEGLLGMDVLGRYQFVIDQDKALLYLRPKGKS